MSEQENQARKTIRVECPCCKAFMVVDAATGVVVSHQEHKKEHQSLDDFFAKQKNRGAELEAKLKAGAEREKNKRDLLEQKFKAAQSNPDLKDPPPGVIWD